MDERSYIEFYQDYSNPEKSEQSDLLLKYLQEEGVNFNANPTIDLMSPVIVLKMPEGVTLCMYHYFDFQNPETVQDFKKRCAAIKKKSALEKKVDGKYIN